MRPRVLAVLALLAGLAASAPAPAFDGLQPGMPAPDVSFESLEGARVSLRDFPRARAVLVVFWAAWSAKSPEVLERVEALYRAHRDAGLVVLGVNVESPTLADAEVRAVRERITRLGLSFPVLLDRGLAAFAAFGVVAVPSSVLLGPDGAVVAALAAYPIAGREDFFDAVEATIAPGRTRTPIAASGPPPSPRAVRYFNLARGMVRRGSTEAATANLRKAVEADRTFPLPRVLLAQLARERAERAMAAGEGRAAGPLSAAERAALLAEADALSAEANRLDPRNPAPVTEMALVARARGDAAGARALLERALALNAEHAPARGHLGALLVGAGEIERGRGELEAAIRLNPVDWRLHLIAAQAWESRGMLAEAAGAYRRGVELLWQSRSDAGWAGR